MEAWSTAVAINTAASFQAFLASYPDSDLTATARKMLERVRNRSLQTSTVALGPSCPCPVQPPQPVQPLKKKVEEPAPKKSVSRQEKPKAWRGNQPRGNQPGGYQQPGIPLIPAIGIGIGAGGALGGGRSGPAPHSYSHGHY
jgi:hypothetical protein